MRLAWQALVVSALLTTNALPCTYFLREADAGKDFDVRVTSQEDIPMPGILVSLKGEISLSGRTDAKGYAIFRSVPVGEYELSTVQRGDGLNDIALIRVKNEVRHRAKVSLKFPVIAVVKSRRLAGGLTFVPAPELLLITAVRQPDETIVATRSTSANGDFNFDSVTPGLYTLEITSPGEHRSWGTIPVLIGSRGPKQLDLALSQTTCGLMYAEACREHFDQVVTAPGACIAAVDQSGAAISGAKVRLTSTTDPSRHFEGTTNYSGHFELVEYVPGEYQLKLEAVGFPPVNKLVRFNAGGCAQRLQIEMALFGCTGKAKLVKTHAASH